MIFNSCFKSCKPLEGGWRKQCHNLIQYAFGQTLLTMYKHFFQILNTGVIRKIIPSQPLWAKEVEVLFFIQIETFNQNLGQGSLSVNSNAGSVANFHLVMQRMTSKTFLWNQKTVMVPYLIGSHYLSKEKSPLSQNLQRRLKKAGASRWLWSRKQEQSGKN